MAIVYGIDLGTTFSSIASISEGDDRPSLVVVESALGQGRQLASELFVEAVNGSPAKAFIGQSAVERSITEGEGLHVAHPKRFIGFPASDRPVWMCAGVEYDPVEMSALLLRKLESAIRTGDPAREISVVVTHPRDYKLPKKQAVEDAVSLCGLHLLQTIDEPVAAALAFFRPDAPEPDGKYLVVDLGGGTLDIAVVAIKDGGPPIVVDGYGDQALGGKDWDDALYEQIIASAQAAHPEFPYEREISTQTRRQLRQLATEWKIGFARRTKQIRRFNTVMHTGSELQTPISVERAAWEAACEPLVERCERAIDKALEAARLAADDVELVLPVGGSVRLPKIQELLARKFPGRVAPIDTPTGVQPDYAVAEGAARYALLLAAQSASRSGVSSEPSVLRTAEGGIQTALANAVNVLVADRKLAVVVAQGAPLPASQTRHFVVEDVGAQLTIAFYEGTRDFAPDGEPPSATLSFQTSLDVRSGDGILVTVDVGPSGRIAARVTHEPSGATIESELRVGEATERNGAAPVSQQSRRAKLSTLMII